MGIYQDAKRDSAGSENSGVNQNFVRSMGFDAAKGLFGHKVKQIKVKIKAGYEVLLKDSNERDN
jgi:hypothetical protein